MTWSQETRPGMRTIMRKYDVAVAQLPGWLQFLVNFIVFALIAVLVLSGLKALSYVGTP